MAGHISDKVPIMRLGLVVLTQSIAIARPPALHCATNLTRRMGMSKNSSSAVSFAAPDLRHMPTAASFTLYLIR